MHIREALAALLEGAHRDGRIDPLLPIVDVVGAMIVIADGLFLRRAVDPAFDAAQTGQTILAMLAGVIRPVQNGITAPLMTTTRLTEEAL